MYQRTSAYRVNRAEERDCTRTNTSSCSPRKCETDMAVLGPPLCLDVVHVAVVGIGGRGHEKAGDAVTRLRSGTRTSAEEVLALELRAAGYEFITQCEYAHPRKLRADFLVYMPNIAEFPRNYLEGRHRVLVEVQGGVFNGRAHGSIEGVLRDIDRLNEASIHGFHMLRFTPDQIDEGYAMTTIRRYFEGA